MYMSVLPSCIYYIMCVPGAHGGEDTGSTRTGATDSYELSCQYEEPNLGSLQEQQMLLAAEPSS